MACFSFAATMANCIHGAIVAACIYCEANLSFLRADLNAKYTLSILFAKARLSFAINIIIIVLAERRPVLDIGFSQDSPNRSVQRQTHRVWCFWICRHPILLDAYPNTVSSSPWMPVKNFLATGHRFRRDVPSLLPLSDSSSYVGNSNSGTDLIISDMTLQENSEHSNLQRYSILTY